MPDECEARFHRGDATADARLDLADAVHIAMYLFLAGPAPGCLDAADANDDGRLDITDAVRVLGFLFLAGPPPPAPGPPGGDCGPDPDSPASPGSLGCERSPPCPRP